MDDESDESMELMEEVPLIQLGEAELERLVSGWRRGAGSWFQRRGEAYWKERSVIRRKDDVDGRASVTKDEERVLRGCCTRLCKHEGWVVVIALSYLAPSPSHLLTSAALCINSFTQSMCPFWLATLRGVAPSRFTRYKAINGSAKCRKWRWFGVVRGHSRSWVMPPFDRTRTISYSTLLETMRLFCTVFEM